jgi:hypothetical protein
MGCGCGKKKGPTIHFMGQGNGHEADPEEWGPIMWRYMHCLIQRIGYSGNSIIDTDQANYLEMMFNNFSSILPCLECQNHARQYMSQNPPPSLKGLYGENLRKTAQLWLFNFHNAVRQRKGQTIQIHNIEQLETEYGECFVAQCEFTILTQSVSYAVRNGWVRVDLWRKWFSYSERMRVLVGSAVVK